jgi:SAM-dependent methyltransferase
MFARMTDQRYLRAEQYRDAANLRARMTLHERFSVNQYPWQRWVFDRLALPAQCRVLELGCGPGKLWLENADRLTRGWMVTLADYSPGMAREARQGLREANLAAASAPAFVYVNLDAQALPFADASYNAIIANHMLYHVPDRVRALAEIRRVLRPGGRFYAATNGEGHLRELDELLTQADLAPLARPANHFTLESGGAELAQVFAQVTLDRYDDGLVVTEAAPLVAYLASGLRYAAADQARIAATVAQELAARDGALHISKSSGLFTAW